MSHTTREIPRARRRSFWTFHHLGRALSLAAASSAGGCWVGALIGLANWISTGNSIEPWWHWVAFTALYGAIWMVVFGMIVGLPLFAALAAWSARWSARRRWRFADAFPTRVLLPLTASLIFTSLLASALWIARVGGLTSATSDWGDVLFRTELATLAAASLIFTASLARFARQPRPARARLESRLLPLQ